MRGTCGNDMPKLDVKQMQSTLQLSRQRLSVGFQGRSLEEIAKFLTDVSRMQIDVLDPEHKSIKVDVEGRNLGLLEALNIMAEEAGLVPVLLPDGSYLLALKP